MLASRLFDFTEEEYQDLCNPGMSASVDNTVARFLSGEPVVGMEVKEDEDPDVLNPLRSREIVDVLDALEVIEKNKELLERYKLLNDVKGDENLSKDTLADLAKDDVSSAAEGK